MKFLQKLYSFLGFVVLFGIFNLVCFLSRLEYTNCFYISVAFGNFSLLLGALTALFSAAKRQVNLIYSYYYMTTLYEIIAIVLNWLFIWFALNNDRANIMINAVIAAVFILLILWSLSADADTNRQAKEHTKKLNYHYDMCDAVRPLRNRGGSLRLNKKIEAFYDAVLNSQINVDNSNLYQKDQLIIAAARRIDVLLNDNVAEEEVISELNRAIALVDERNEYVKNSYMRGV